MSPCISYHHHYPSFCAFYDSHSYFFILVLLDCMFERMFADVGMAVREVWWIYKENAYFKGQVGMEYRW